jgi:hypothetical protein
MSQVQRSSMLSLLTTLVLLQAPTATAVIWGGGTSENAAAKSLELFEKKRKAWDFISIAQGFPKIVASGSMPGLNPGFNVVLLGLCAKQSRAVDILDLLEPALYVKSVPSSGIDSCPSFSIPGDSTDAQFVVSQVKQTQVEGFDLSAFSVLRTQGTSTETVESSWQVFLSLGKKGKPTVQRMLRSEGTEVSEVKEINIAPNGFSFDERFVSPSCANGNDFTEWNRTWNVTVNKGQIRSPTPKAKSGRSGHCDPR